MDYKTLTLKDVTYKVRFYDTETYNDKELQDKVIESMKPGGKPVTEAGVWLWYCIDAEEDYNTAPWGMSAATFISYLKRITSTGDNYMIYLFNFGFEWSYLGPELIKRQGFRQCLSPTDMGENTYYIITNTSQSSVYEVKLKFSKDGGVVVFKDLHKLFVGGSLRSLADDFDLDIKKTNIYKSVKKLSKAEQELKDEEGYDLMRRGGYYPTDSERQYCWADCKVLAELYCKQVDSYNDWKKTHPNVSKIIRNTEVKVPVEETDEGKEFFDSFSVASWAMKMLINESYVDVIYKRKDRQTFKRKEDGSKVKNGTAKNQLGNKTKMVQYRQEFPKLYAFENDFARASYEGGLCYPTARYGGCVIRGLVGHADVVSQYPSQICCRDRFPKGRGRYFTGWKVPRNNRMYLYCIKYAYEQVILIPSLKMTAVPEIWSSDFSSMDLDPKEIRMNPDRFKTKKAGDMPVVLYVWDFYLPILARCLKGFRYEVVDGFEYRCGPSRFAPYFRTHFDLKNKYKAEHKTSAKMVEKYLINSPTGKFGEKPHNDVITLYDDDFGISSHGVGKLPYEKGYHEHAKYTYVPFISAITAYAREFLLSTCFYLGVENVCYMDTDSIMFIENKETMIKVKNPDIFGTTMMHFEYDAEYMNPYFAKPKAYSYCEIEHDKDGNLHGFLDCKSGGFSDPPKVIGTHLGGNDDGTDYYHPMRQMMKTVNGQVYCNRIKRFSSSKVDYYHEHNTIIDLRNQQREDGILTSDHDKAYRDSICDYQDYYMTRYKKYPDLIKSFIALRDDLMKKYDV